MEAATIETRPVEATETFTFISRGRAERLVRRPQNIVRDEFGAQRQTQAPVRVEFRAEGSQPGKYVAVRGRHMMTDSDATVVDNEELKRRGLPLKGEERDEVDWLRGHPQYGVRFHEEGREADRPLPLEQDFNADVVQAVAALNVDRLVELRDAEAAGHDRAVLIQTAEAAIASVGAQTEQETAAVKKSQEPPQA